MSAKVMEARVQAFIETFNIGRYDCIYGPVDREAVQRGLEAADKARGGEAIAFVGTDGKLAWIRDGQGVGPAVTLPVGSILYTHPADGVDLEQFRATTEFARDYIRLVIVPRGEAVAKQALAEANSLLALIDQHSKGRSE